MLYHWNTSTQGRLSSNSWEKSVIGLRQQQHLQLPRVRKVIAQSSSFQSLVFQYQNQDAAGENTQFKGQAFPTEGQHSIPAHYLLVFFSIIAFFSIHSSLSTGVSNTLPCYSSFPGAQGSLVQYLPRVLCSPKERFLQFSCWKSCKSKTNNSEIPSSIQLNNNHKTQQFGFYDLLGLVSEDLAKGASVSFRMQ